MLAKREYRGQRSADSILQFVREEIRSPVKLFSSLDDLVGQLDDKKRHIIGYFATQDSEAYRAFERAASTLKNDCDFLAGTGESQTDTTFDGKPDSVSYRPSVSRTNDDDEVYTGDLTDKDRLEGKSTLLRYFKIRLYLAILV